MIAGKKSERERYLQKRRLCTYENTEGKFRLNVEVIELAAVGV